MGSEQLWRNITFVMGLAVCLCAGTLYAWAAYSVPLREQLNWSQKEANLVQSLGALGQYIGFSAGKVNDYFGPRKALVLSATLAFAGYFLMYLAVKTGFTTTPVVFGLFYLLVGQGSITMYMPVLSVNTKNFDAKRRGAVIGTLSAGFGLSSVMFTFIYKGLYSSANNVEGFLLTCAIILGCVDVLAAALVRSVPPAVERTDTSTEPLVDEAASETTEPINSSATEISEQSAILKQDQHEGTKDVDISGMALLKNVDFLLLFALFGLGSGSGLMFIGNVSALGKANDFSSDRVAALVIFLNLCNCIGRFIVGSASDVLRYRFSNAFFCLITCAVIGIGHLLLTFQQGNMIYAGAALNGLAYGGLFCITPKLVFELFGQRSFGFNFGIVTIALAAGNYALGAVAGAIYDSHAIVNPTDGKKECYGDECFRSSFIVTVSCCALACVIAVVLSRRTKSYAQLL